MATKPSRTADPLSPTLLTSTPSKSSNPARSPSAGGLSPSPSKGKDSTRVDIPNTIFTKRQLAELEDVFHLFNYHTHSGIMRADDLGIALRVLGLEITREQHKGYVSLYSTSATNLKEHEAQERNESSSPGPPAQQEQIGKMANLKASMNYFTFSDFVEICEDAKEARDRQQLALTHKDSDQQEWLHNAFDSFDEASLSAASLQKSLQKLFSSIQGHRSLAGHRDEDDSDGDIGSDNDRRRARPPAHDDDDEDGDRQGAGSFGGGSLNVDVPSLSEVMEAFRDLGIDANLGMTYEDLLRILGDSSGIL